MNSQTFPQNSHTWGKSHHHNLEFINLTVAWVWPTTWCWCLRVMTMTMTMLMAAPCLNAGIWAKPSTPYFSKWHNVSLVVLNWCTVNGNHLWRKNVCLNVSFVKVLNQSVELGFRNAHCPLRMCIMYLWTLLVQTDVAVSSCFFFLLLFFCF